MSVKLRDVITTDSVLKINQHRRGGTYVSFVCHPTLIPPSEYLMKKEWGVVFVKSYKDEQNPDEAIVEIIHEKPPFEFLKNVLGCEPRTSLGWLIIVGNFVFSREEICFDGKNFSSEPKRAKPSEKVRNLFAKILAGGLRAHPVLEKNLKVFSKYKDTEAGKQFSPYDFYYKRIGDATGFDELDWGKMKLTRVDIVTQKLSEETRFVPASVVSKEALAEKFASANC